MRNPWEVTSDHCSSNYNKNKYKFPAFVHRPDSCTYIVPMGSFAKSFILEFKNKEIQEINEYIDKQKNINLGSFSNEQIVDYYNNILEHLRNKTCISFVKAARLGFYYSQKLIDILQNKFSMGKDEAIEIFSKLTQGLDDSAITNANISISEANSDEEALEIARKLVGHFSTDEMLEIRHLRLNDVPSALWTYVAGIRNASNYHNLYTKQKTERINTQEKLLNEINNTSKVEFEHILKYTQTYMALRETIKYMVSQEYSLLKDGLQLLEKKIGLDKDEIYFIYPRELLNFVKSPSLMLHLLEARKQSYKNYQFIEMPSIIRESDIDKLNLLDENSNEFTQVTGSFLAQGIKVMGVIVNLDEFEDLDKAYIIMKQYIEQNKEIILVATQMNLTHDPFIALSSGLVIENAGIVSHGAQRTRELGKGAISGVKSNILKTGTMAFFDPEQKTLRNLKY